MKLGPVINSLTAWLDDDEPFLNLKDTEYVSFGSKENSADILTDQVAMKHSKTF